jgi:MoxR-like ATPase
MNLDFQTFLRIAKPILDAKLPLLLRGRHGIGKSQVVYQIAAERNLPVVERRASQMSEGDLVGLPVISGDTTSWNPPDWFKTACNNAVLLFLDEVDRAVIEVRQGIFELTDSRKLNGHVLHPDTIIVAAVNGGQSGSQYQVGEMDPAELDRWTAFDLDPTVEDWLIWAKDSCNPFVYDFINLNREHLEHKGDFEPNKVYPSRRSWKRLNDVLVNADMFSEENAKDIRNLALGFVGYEAAIALHDFVEKYDRQVTVDDILVKGQFDKVKSFGIIEHCALIDKLTAPEVINKILPKDKMDNLVRYFLLLPGEAAMKMWQDIGKSECQENTLSFYNTNIDGAKASAMITTILTGKKTK